MNDTQVTSSQVRATSVVSRRTWTIVAVLVVIAAVIPGYYGFSALADPAARDGITGPATADLVQYASLYGIRAIVIAISTLAVLAAARRRATSALLAVLALGGLVQVGDVLLYLVLGAPMSAIGPAISAIIPLACASVLVRTRGR